MNVHKRKSYSAHIDPPELLDTVSWLRKSIRYVFFFGIIHQMPLPREEFRIPKLTFHSDLRRRRPHVGLCHALLVYFLNGGRLTSWILPKVKFDGTESCGCSASIPVPNLVKISQRQAELWRFTCFQNGCRRHVEFTPGVYFCHITVFRSWLCTS